jgi:hypothetical protein
MIFLDETSFSVSMRRFYGRAQVGQKAIATAPTLRSRNISVMAKKCTESLVHYKVLGGPGNRENMLLFLDELFEILRTKRQENVLIIMDNASFIVVLK